MKPETIDQIVHTTVGDLAAAYYEAALSELGDAELAARVSRDLVMQALNNNRDRD
jgi:hypothetical protein